jgi:hypothetical protein
MPEKLVMHPDMTDEEWARWDCVLSELSKTTSLAPFCSGISTEKQSKSDVLPYEYDTLKTNNQANRAEATASTQAQNTDAASVVPTSATENGGSGSTLCSFSAISFEFKDVVVTLKGDTCPRSITYRDDSDDSDKRYMTVETEDGKWTGLL